MPIVVVMDHSSVWRYLSKCSLARASEQDGHGDAVSAACRHGGWRRFQRDDGPDGCHQHRAHPSWQYSTIRSNDRAAACPAPTETCSHPAMMMGGGFGGGSPDAFTCLPPQMAGAHNYASATRTTTAWPNTAICGRAARRCRPYVGSAQGLALLPVDGRCAPLRSAGPCQLMY